MVFKKHLQSHASKWKKLNFVFRQQFIIVSKMWWQVFLVTSYTAVILGLNFYNSYFFYMGWSASLVPILGVVTGLLLVFRTNTAYDRYYEGRRLWSQMIQVIRVLTRSVWIIVPEESARNVVEKKSVTNLFVAYAISSKHYLREEYSYDHKDLKELIQHLPQMFSEPRSDGLKKMRILNYAPPSNIPLQILLYISIFVETMKDRYKWDPATSGIFYNGMNSLAECLSGFERIKRTPIPAAYSVHLNHVTWLYILSLPFQLAESMGWWTVAGVGITSFTFLGILEIGSQIEDPFGYDDNDLPLEDLCDVLRTEVNDILSTTFPTHEELFVSKDYFPISNCALTASELSMKTISEVKSFLLEEQLKNMEPAATKLTDLKIIK